MFKSTNLNKNAGKFHDISFYRSQVVGLKVISATFVYNEKKNEISYFYKTFFPEGEGIRDAKHRLDSFYCKSAGTGT